MKKNFIVCLIILSFRISYAQITFQKTYGRSGTEDARSVQQTSDGGYIIVGSTNTLTAGSEDVYLIKTNLYGDTIWSKTYGGIGSDIGWSVEQISDGGYIVSGSTGSFGAGISDVYFIRTNSTGDTVWTKTYGGSGVDEGYSIKQTFDGGFIIAGTSSNALGAYGEALLIKTDNNGDTMWTKTYGDAANGNVFFISAQQTPDSGYILAGANSIFAYVVRVNYMGDTLWTRVLGKSVNPISFYANCIRQTNDGGYIVIGSADYAGAGSFDSFVIKLNANGDVEWSKLYGGVWTDRGYCIAQTLDGGYIMLANTNSFGFGMFDIYLTKTDSLGNPAWTKAIGFAMHDWGRYVQETADGGFIITGVTSSFGAGNSDFFLIKTDSQGNNGCNNSGVNTIITIPAVDVINYQTTFLNVHPMMVASTFTIINSGSIITNICFSTGVQPILGDEFFNISVSSNPFTTTLTIKGTTQKGELVIFDITGKEILHQKTFSEETKINTAHLTPGFYFVNYREGERNVNKKVVKM